MRNKRYRITWYAPRINKYYVIDTLPTTFEKAMCYAKHGRYAHYLQCTEVVSVEPVKRKKRQKDNETVVLLTEGEQK